MTNTIDFIALNCTVLTISDSRTDSDDKSGNYLVSELTTVGHQVIEKTITPDNVYQIRAHTSRWIANPNVDVIITNGGTGVTGRDGTPEAIAPLLDKTIEGFGELFRALSYQDIQTSALQSRAIAGVANGTYLFCLPGSSGACKTAWETIIKAQLDRRTQPCNLVMLIPRLLET